MSEIPNSIIEILRNFNEKFLLIDHEGTIHYLSESIKKGVIFSSLQVRQNYNKSFRDLNDRNAILQEGNSFKEFRKTGKVHRHDCSKFNEDFFIIKIKESKQGLTGLILEDFDFLNQLRIGIVIWDPILQESVFVNRVLENKLETPPNELGKFEQYSEVFKGLLETGNDFLENQQISSLKGNKLLLNISKVPIIDPERGLNAYIIEDITPFHKTILDLRRTSSRLRRLFSTMAQGVIYHDAEGTITDANKASLEILGVTLEQIKGLKSNDQRWQTIREDGSTFPMEQHPAIISLNKGIKVKNVTMGVFHPLKKTYIWLLVNSQPTFSKNSKKVVDVISTFTDITEQVIGEQKLRKEIKLQELLATTSMDYIHIGAKKLKPTIERTLKELGEFMEADRTYIFEYDYQKKITNNTYEWCAEGIEAQIENLQGVPFDLIEEWLEVHFKGEIMHIDDVSLLPEELKIKESLTSQDIQSLIAVPIMDGEKPIGFIGIDSVRKKHFFSESEINLVKVFGALLENIHQKITNLSHLKQRIKELSCIFKISDLTQKQPHTQEEFFKEVLSILPSGFQEPITTKARLQYGAKQFKSKGFKLTDNHILQCAQVESDNLCLEICIPNNKDFSKEEKQLVKGTLVIIQKHIENLLNIEKVQKNEQELQNILNSQSNYLIRFNQDHNITFANDKFYQDYEAELGVIEKGKPLSIYKLISESDHNKLRNAVASAAVEPGKIVSQELTFTKVDLPAKTFLWEFVCLSQRESDILDIQAIAVDISLQKQAENDLQKSEKRLKSLINSQTHYLIRTDLNGYHTFWNPAFERDFGWIYETSGNDYQNSLSSICPYHHDKTLEVVRKCIAEPGRRYRIELDKPTQDGKVVVTDWDFICLTNDQGEPFELQCSGVDITEKKVFENALKESEERFRSIADNSGSVIWETDEEGRYTYLSPVCKRIFGYKPEELIGTHFYDLFPSAYKEEYKSRGIKLIDKKGDVQAFENPIFRKDGEIIWVNTYATPYQNEKGELLGYRGADIDITAEKKSKEELLKFEIISNQAQQGNVVTDIEGNISYCNKAFSTMHGYEPEELIGQNLKILHTEEQINYFYKEIFPIAKLNGEYKLKELGRKRKDGSVFPSLTSAKLIKDQSNKVIFNAGWVIDISEKKEQEEKLLAILDAIPDMIFINDRDGNYLEYYDSKLGNEIGDFSHLKGKTLQDFFNKKYSQLHLKKIQECLKKDELITYEYPIIIGDKKRFFESRTVKMSENKVLRFVRDISERVEAEKEIYYLNQSLEDRIKQRTKQLENLNLSLVNAKADAEKANQAKSEFLSRMSHELRTPMNAILGFAQLLEVSTLDSKQQRKIEHILKGGQHLLNLINEVLDLSSIEAGKINMQIETLRAQDLIEDAIETVLPFLIEKSIKVTQPSIESKYILGDKQRLKQVLINILNNAIKYNHPNGDIKIEIKENQNQENNNIRIEISDTGIGIRKQDISRLFHPFERIGAELSETEGTGLGLSVVKRLVELMNGKVGVKSIFGKGSTFWIDLPKARLEKPNGNIRTISNKPSLSVGEHSKGTVLYIEDNLPNIQLVQEIIQSSLPKIKLKIENYGKKGIESCLKILPDLILLDLHLPDIHGKEVLIKLKNNIKTRHIPVIILTADAISEKKIDLHQLGAAGTLSKPISITIFIELLKKYLK